MAVVPAVITARRVSQMQREGYTKAAIARALGLRHPTLQVRLVPGAKVTARTAARVGRLHYRWLLLGADDTPDRPQ